ncbi:MAG: response regulator FixJ [Acidibrevibacterium sp.]|uniref:response regulator FixJ n=1 Tax=Acidibrevibacterium sp. TaxID=2606776 RepID=UPI003D02D5AD
MTDPEVIVVDDDEAVRESLCFLLEAAGYRCQAFASGVAVLAAPPGPGAGCLLLDVRMPEIDGVTTLERLRAAGVRIPTIIMTGHADVPLAVRAMKAGARDFVEKPFSDGAILEAVGQALVDVGTDAPGREALARLATLSPREREVLDGLVAGLPNKTIAYDLGISPRTVEIHRAHVMEKFGARSLSELVRLALAAGIDPGARHK